MRSPSLCAEPCWRRTACPRDSSCSGSSSPWSRRVRPPWPSIAWLTLRLTLPIRAPRPAPCPRAHSLLHSLRPFVVVSCASVRACGLPPEPSGAAAFSGRAGGGAALLLHQALYPLVAPGSWDSRWALRRPPPGLRCAGLSIPAFCCSPRRSRSGWAASMCSTLARTMNSTGKPGLHSIPRYFGIGRALWIARFFHVLMLILLIGLVVAFGLGKLAVVGVIVVTLASGLRALAGFRRPIFPS